MAGFLRRLRFRVAAWISGGDAEELMNDAQEALRARYLGQPVAELGKVRAEIVQNLVDAIDKVDNAAFPLGDGFIALKATVDGQSSSYMGPIPQHITVDEESICDPRALLEQVLGDKVAWSAKRLLEVEPSDPKRLPGGDGDDERTANADSSEPE